MVAGLDVAIMKPCDAHVGWLCTACVSVPVVGGRHEPAQERSLLYGILYTDHSGYMTIRRCYQQIAQSNWKGGLGGSSGSLSFDRSCVRPAVWFAGK